MKKLFLLLLMCAMQVGMLGPSVFAAGSSYVYVTIADANGKLVLVREKIALTDTDGDGSLTVADALYAAHEAKYEGGAAAGFAFSMGQYGLQLDMLWGTANGGAYGYYVNNVSAMSLSNTLSDGDSVNAFVYTDLTSWSDTYCFFDLSVASVDLGEELTLKLSYCGYDVNWNPVTLPLAGVTVTAGGNEYATDSDGRVTLTFASEGSYVVSATSAAMTLVPPVCVVTVSAAGASEGFRQVILVAAVFALAAAVFILRKMSNENK